jgi:DNA/RNA endonuclease YhcR with UshA esterase domain
MPKPSTLLATLVLAAWMPGAQAGAETVVKPEDAATHAGQTVVVEGTVAKVSSSQRSATTFLNFCAPYPNQCFTAVIFQSARSLFADPQGWEGKKVRVSGRVKVYKGKPEIVLEKPSQIQSAQ